MSSSESEREFINSNRDNLRIEVIKEDQKDLIQSVKRLNFLVIGGLFLVTVIILHVFNGEIGALKDNSHVGPEPALAANGVNALPKESATDIQPPKESATVIEPPKAAVAAPPKQLEQRFDANKHANDMDLIELDKKIELWENAHKEGALFEHRAYNQKAYKHIQFQGMPPVENDCSELLTFGKGDGEKYYCNDDKEMSDPNCIVISLGSNGDYSFEVDVVTRTKCHVHTFDCTGDFPPPPQQEDRITWHKKCLGDPAHGPDFLNFEQSLVECKPGNWVPAFLKMDIEGFEFEVMRHVLATEAIERLPTQISLELHGASNEKFLNWHHRYKTELEIHSFMNMLQEIGKYKLINRDDNMVCGHCTEILVKRYPDKSFSTFKNILGLFDNFFADSAHGGD